MSVNKAILVGHLGKDPELRYTQNQHPVCSFSIATNDRRKDQSGEWTDHTEWHNIVVWGKVAENCSRYLKKGRQVYIEGRLQTRKWQDKEGRDRYTTEIVAQTVQFLGSKGSGAGGDFAEGPHAGSGTAGGVAGGSGASLVEAVTTPADKISAAPEVSFEDDDIPF